MVPLERTDPYSGLGRMRSPGQTATSAGHGPLTESSTFVVNCWEGMLTDASARPSLAMRCASCGRLLADGTPAVWERGSQRLLCADCSMPGGPRLRPVDQGTPGFSANEEYQRRAMRYAARVRAEWGARADEVLSRGLPDHALAWNAGAAGEARVAAALAGLPGIVALHDRAVPGTRANIDHLIVARAGVFVVDSKLQRGNIRVRQAMGESGPEMRLYVGRRDRSNIADSLEWQMTAVEAALNRAGLHSVPTWPIACFVGRDWPSGLGRFRGVSLETERSLRELLFSSYELDGAAGHHVARVLSNALPPRATRGQKPRRESPKPAPGQAGILAAEGGTDAGSAGLTPVACQVRRPMHEMRHRSRQGLRRDLGQPHADDALR